MASADPSTHAGEITRDDIESKFRDLLGDVESTAESARSYLFTAGVVAAVLVVLVVFLLGRRRGRMARTVVEVRRV